MNKIKNQKNVGKIKLTNEIYKVAPRSRRQKHHEVKSKEHRVRVREVTFEE